MNPQDAGPYLEMGKSCRSQGRLAEAEVALRQALEHAPQNGWARLELGTLFLDQGRLSEATAEFEKAIAIDRSNSGAYGQLGRIFHRQGQWSEAEASLREALELDIRNVGARIELGSLYEDQRRFVEAAGEFERVIAMDSNHGATYCQLGRIRRKQGRFPQAEAALRKALELDSRNVGARIELGVLCEHQGRFPQAEAELRKALEIDAADCRAHLELGALYEEQSRFPEAAAEFAKALAIDPRNAGVHLYLGRAHLRLERWAEAEAGFQKAAELDSRNEDACIGLWAVYRGQGRAAEAGAAMAKAMAINPRSVSVGIELLDRLDRDRAVGDCAREPRQERVFCLLPWTRLHIHQDGTSLPCCLWKGPPLGDVRSSSLEELWNSPGVKALRADMMSGRPVAGCWRCYQDERSGLCSQRQRANIDLDRHRDRERLTAPDGTLPRLPVPWIDIQFSNICNLRCRTCSATASSAWMADAQALGLPVEGGPIQKPYEDWDSFWRQLQPLLEEGVEEIRFAGGEPLVMEEHYRILDFLIARGLTDVRLYYNTNFSILWFQGRDLIDLWSRFRKVHVGASLDGSGRRGEYLRKGLCWDAVVANREEMLRRCPHVAFHISTTVSIFNVLHLPDFHREWVEKGYIERNDFELNNVLVTPAMYRMQILPPALKERVQESYRRHRESFLDTDGRTTRDFATVARLMGVQDRSELLPEFVAMTRRLDQLRGEDCREVFPELAELFEGSE